MVASGVGRAGVMASHAVEACTPAPSVTRRSSARGRVGGGGGRTSARGRGTLVREKRMDWRCRPSLRVLASPGSCDLYDVSDDLTPYDVAWRWQKTILDARLASLSAARDQADDRTRDDRTASPSSLEKDDPHHRLLGASDCLLLVQHPSVVTLGTGSTPANLKFDPDDPSAPFEVFRTERGGEATYHGPGQIVLYPILDLAQRKPDLHWYMRSLEEVAILAMKDLGVMYAGRIEGLTGGWANVTGDADACANLSSMNETTDDRPSPVANRAHKVAAIGVRARRWVTYHGMAFNVDPDLSEFRHIVPCGIADRPVGSIAQILEGQAGITSSGAEDSRRTRRNECSDSGRAAGIGPDAALMRRAKKALVRAFEEVFETALIQRGGAPPV